MRKWADTRAGSPSTSCPLKGLSDAWPMKLFIVPVWLASFMLLDNALLVSWQKLPGWNELLSHDVSLHPSLVAAHCWMVISWSQV